MKNGIHIPRPDIEAGFTDDEAMGIIELMADNLEKAQELLGQLKPILGNPEHIELAQARAAQAQALSLYLLICSALDNEKADE